MLKGKGLYVTCVIYLTYLLSWATFTNDTMRVLGLRHGMDYASYLAEFQTTKRDFSKVGNTPLTRFNFAEASHNLLLFGTLESHSFENLKHFLFLLTQEFAVAFLLVLLLLVNLHGWKRRAIGVCTALLPFSLVLYFYAEILRWLFYSPKGYKMVLHSLFHTRYTDQMTVKEATTVVISSQLGANLVLFWLMENRKCLTAEQALQSALGLLYTCSKDHAKAEDRKAYTEIVEKTEPFVQVESRLARAYYKITSWVTIGLMLLEAYL